MSKISRIDLCVLDHWGIWKSVDGNLCSNSIVKQDWEWSAQGWI